MMVLGLSNVCVESYQVGRTKNIFLAYVSKYCQWGQNECLFRMSWDLWNVNNISKKEGFSSPE